MRKLEWRQVGEALHLYERGTFPYLVTEQRSLCGLHPRHRSGRIDDITLRVCKTCDKLGGRHVEKPKR